MWESGEDEAGGQVTFVDKRTGYAGVWVSSQGSTSLKRHDIVSLRAFLDCWLVAHPYEPKAVTVPMSEVCSWESFTFGEVFYLRAATEDHGNWYGALCPTKGADYNICIWGDQLVEVVR